MKKFAVKISFYLAIFIAIIFIGIWLPPTSTNNILFSLQDKMKLVDSTQKANQDKPIIYWVGGSNINFGLDSKLISDSLKTMCVNTGVHGGLGLKFELNNALRFARKNDIIVLIPEYENFWKFNNEMADGQCELLHTIMDIYPDGKSLIEKNQIQPMLMYLPRYLHDKYVQYFPTNYIKRNKKELGAYVRYNFNNYGDVILHLNKPSIPFLAMPKLGAPINLEIINFLVSKEKISKQKGIQLYILFPSYQQTSYNNNKQKIDELAQIMHLNKLPVISTPEHYVFNDSLFYDTYYHLTKKGREIRSIFVQQDLKAHVAKIQ